MDLYAVIMAGGIGARFWPRSRFKKPKQLIKIFGEKTLLQETVNRLKGMIPNEKIFIVTNRLQTPEIKNQVPDIPEENIIDEPFGKNTSACIGLAAVRIKKNNPDALMIALPSDHLIPNVEEFQKTLQHAADFAAKGDNLVTIAIRPSRPETGYGYIQIDDNPAEDGIFKALTFAEKPNKATAERFIMSGEFMWNSGIFVWKVCSILNEMRVHLPEHFEGLEKIEPAIGSAEYEKVLSSVYGQFKNISIDYGVMEKSSNVYTTVGNFIWSDVGSWEEVYNLSNKDEENNSFVGEVFAQDATGSYVFSPNKFTALLGLKDVIVINTNDSLLICSKERAQDVKNVVDYLKLKKMNDYL